MQDDIHDVVLEEEDGEGNTASLQHKNKELREKLKRTEAECGENLAGWQRTKADFVNLQRRMREAEASALRTGMARIITEVVAVFDSLEAAAASGASDIAPIVRQLEAALQRHGVLRYTPQTGERFDPERHEPMQVVATTSKEEDNTIASALQSGYLLDSAVIRPARVSVFHFEA